ncbi:MAG: preprotein translocase subunit YajC [Nitrosomonas sp.]|jgi:preprotein translocase subunit YajC|nr:preprotein translocase subunit YajC [Nitrosomonas sp.]
MFISEAYAQAAGAAQAEPTFMSFLPLIGIVVIFYFLLIRPQAKRAKEQKVMRDTLQKGDEIIIGGGELGRVVSVGEHYITMELAPNIEITVLKSSIQTLLPKGTLKNIDTGKTGRALKQGKQQKANGSRQEETASENDPQPEAIDKAPGTDNTVAETAADSEKK